MVSKKMRLKLKCMLRPGMSDRRRSDLRTLDHPDARTIEPRQMVSNGSTHIGSALDGLYESAPFLAPEGAAKVTDINELETMMTELDPNFATNVMSRRTFERKINMGGFKEFCSILQTIATLLPLVTPDPQTQVCVREAHRDDSREEKPASPSP